MSGLKFGISTSCFYPMVTEEAVVRLAQAGVDWIELFFNADSELSGTVFDGICRTLSASQTRVASVHPFTSGFEPMLLFSNYERRFRDSVEYYKRFFNAAACLGARYLVIHGDRVQSPLPEELYFERYQILQECAAPFGVRLAQENVSRCKGRSLDFLVRMKEALGDDAAFVLDLKQAIRSETPYEDILDALGSSVRHIHISDHTSERDCLPLGKGDLNCGAFLQDLRTRGYTGAVLLELYRDNYGGYEELYDCYRLLCRENEILGAT